MTTFQYENDSFVHVSVHGIRDGTNLASYLSSLGKLRFIVQEFWLEDQRQLMVAIEANPNELRIMSGELGIDLVPFRPYEICEDSLSLAGVIFMMDQVVKRLFT